MDVGLAGFFKVSCISIGSVDLHNVMNRPHLMNARVRKQDP